MKVAAALPVVLFTLAISTALSVGGLYVTRQLARSATAIQLGREVELAAEGAIVATVSAWDSAALANQPIGTATQRSSTLSTPELVVTLWITRVSEPVYWIVAEARSGAKPLYYKRLGLSITTRDGRPRPISLRAWVELPE